MVETQLCKLRGKPDTFVGRPYSFITVFVNYDTVVNTQFVPLVEIWHLFISRRCYAVYDLRRQAPATTTLSLIHI